MPLRTRFKRFLAGSEGKETTNEPDQTDGDQKVSDLQIKTAKSELPLIHATPPQSFQLRDLWIEAYEQLREEDEQLIVAYEKSLLIQGKAQSGGQQTGDVFDKGHETQLQHLIERRLADIQETRLQITVGGRDVVVKDQARRIIHTVLSFKDAISSAVSSEPHAALAWGGILMLLNPVLRAITQEEDAIDGFEQILGLLIRYRLLEFTHLEVYTSTNPKSRSIKPLEEIYASLRTKTINLYKEVLKYQMRLAKQYSYSWSFRFLRDLVAVDNWKDMLQSITEIDQNIKDNLEFLGGHALKTIDDKLENLQTQMVTSLDLITEARNEAKASKQLQLLEKLPYAEGAVFNSFEDRGKRQCLAGTQVDILTKIQDWMEDPDGRHIFWLRGMAGTGKSTISRTFAASSHSRTRLVTGEPLPSNLCLGASFFFNQYEPLRNNAKRLFTTLAWSLAEAIPSLKAIVCDAINNNPRIGDELPENQWKCLIFQPLLELGTRILCPITLVIVIDALDECKPDSDLSLIVKLMSRVKDLHTINIRFFLTSRPEAHIRSCFRGLSPNLIYETVLNKVTVSNWAGNVQNDITLFLTHELATIQQKNQIAEDWPGQTNIHKLAIKADGLFIYAATACRFLDGPSLTRSRLDMRLKMIFDNKVTGDSPQKNLDAIYTSILQFSVLGDAIEEEKTEISSLFKQIVGSIVVLFEPLSPQSLATLVDTSLSSVEETLKSLHSVLAVPEKSSETVQLLHLSFRDFLIDNQRCLDDNFCISEATAHETIFQNSVKVMSTMLRHDLCGLHSPAMELFDIERSQISQHIPTHLQYACRYWVRHLQHSGVQPIDNDEVHQFLRTHLLHWLEALSLLGKMDEGVREILVLSEYLATLPAEGRIEVKFLVQDARRFVLKFGSVIELSPLQIYNSALVFSPEMSVVGKLFQHKIPKWLDQIPTRDPQWDSLLQTLGSYSGVDLVLSPDGKLAASCGLIWDTWTGTLVKNLESWDDVNSVAFSPDGKTLISVTWNRTVKTWDVATGLLVLELSTDTSSKHMPIVVFSKRRNMAAIVGSDSTSIIITNINGGKYIKRDSAHSGDIMNLAFSPDGAVLVSASEDGTVRFWDTTTADLRLSLGEHRGGVSTVAFSPNGQILASAAMDKTISLWSADTGAILVKIYYKAEEIRFLAFSPDSSLLASTDKDGSLCLFDVDTGAIVQKIDGEFTAPVFSPNGEFLTSTGGWYRKLFSYSSGIKFWETKSGRLAKIVADQNDLYCNVLFSPDSNVLISSTETRIQLWDANLTASRHLSNAHTTPVLQLTLDTSLERAMSFDGDSLAIIWDLSTANVLRNITLKGQFYFRLAVSPDGSLIATSGPKGSIEILDFQTGKLLITLTGGHEGAISKLVFSSDNKVLASAASGIYHSLEPTGVSWKFDPETPDPSICLWDTSTGGLLQRIDGPLGDKICLDFSMDGMIIAAATYADSTLHLWNAKTGESYKSLDLDGRLVNDMTFSPNGKMVAITDIGQKVSLWDIDTEELVRTLEHAGVLIAARFSPDGRILATMSQDPTIQLWNPATGELLGFYEYVAHGSHNLDPIYFSEDGEYLNTRMGRLSIEMICPGLLTSEISKHDSEIYVRNPWVFRGTEKILLLPLEYYATCAAYRDGILVMGHENGRISIIRFDQNQFIDSVHE